MRVFSYLQFSVLGLILKFSIFCGNRTINCTKLNSCILQNKLHKNTITVKINYKNRQTGKRKMYILFLISEG